MKPKNEHAVALGKLGGAKRSPAKTLAARANAKRPRPTRSSARAGRTAAHGAEPP